jgi:hypothetical protein
MIPLVIKPVFQSHDQVLVLTRGGHYQDKSDPAGVKTIQYASCKNRHDTGYKEES